MDGTTLSRPAWVEVNLGRITHNMREIRGIVDKSILIMAVVKANGYGHGAVEVARTVLTAGADRLAVTTLEEGKRLRQAGIEAPIIVFGYIPNAYIQCALEHKLMLTVANSFGARAISRVAEEMGTKAIVHIKVDTGMGRLGFLPGPKSIDEIRQICDFPGLSVEGIYSHLATADHKDKTYALEQFTRFTDLLNSLEKHNCRFTLRHIANSAALIDLPETHLDMVRPGIIIYGLYPSQHVDKNRICLKPAMSLKAQITHVKKVAAGTSISYGRTYRTAKETTIVTLPIGYADGYARGLSNKGEVLIRGKKLPVVGTVCMDQTMVDGTLLDDVSTGDEVVLFGEQDNITIPVEEIAERLNTINYEIVCMMNERLPRVYI